MKTPSIWMALFAFLIVSCTNTTESEHGHAHEEGGLEPLSYTLYTAKTEVFVEFKPLVVGAASNFATHVTILGEQFTAMTEGKVTVSLIVGEKGLRSTADAPSSPGIFRLSLQPTLAGRGKLIFDIEGKSYKDQLIIPDIEVFANESAALAKQGGGGGDPEIVYLKEQAWKVEFANSTVTKGPFGNVIRTHGEVQSAPGDEVVVSAGASGTVRFSGTKIIEGANVGQGTGLFTLSGGNMAERNLDVAYHEAKANFDKAKADYDRATELAKDRIVSQKELSQAKLTHDNAQLVYQSISRNYSSGGQTISSPISGFVKAVYVQEGQFVEAGTPLALVSQNKKLILQAYLSQKYWTKVGSTISANFRTTGSDRFLSTDSLNGRVVSFGKSATQGSPFIPVMFEINNVGDIIPGAAAEIFLKSTPDADALTFPASAIMEEQGSYYVYVQTGGESFEKREVKIGASDGIRIQALSGVQEGERVVTKGAHQIKLATASGKMPAHGHEH